MKYHVSLGTCSEMDYFEIRMSESGAVSNIFEQDIHCLR